MHDSGQLLARRQLGGLHATFVNLAVGEKPEAVADAAHVQRLGELRLEAGADDELGRAAADVDHQASVRGGGQRMRHAQIDEARLLAARDHLDREAEHLPGFAQELGRVLRYTQRIGAHRAHCLTREAAQPLGELGKRLERQGLRAAVDAFLGGEPGAQAHHLAHRIERVDLAVDHPSDLQVKAVRAEIDRRQSVVTRHRQDTVTRNR